MHASTLAPYVLFTGLTWLATLSTMDGCPTSPIDDGETVPPADEGDASEPLEADLERLFSPPEVAIAFAIATDGRMFYTERDTGRVRIVRDGHLLDPTDLALPVNSAGGERGLLGIALHPDFDINGRLYVYYSRSASGEVVSDIAAADDLAGIRVSELRVVGDEVMGPEIVVVEFPVDEPATLSHFGGNIHFGPDDKLYVTRGDLFDRPRAQDLERTAGRILRYNDDGTIPADNPFGPANPTWALGLRNSFDFTFDPISGAIFATENGTDAHDELNRINPGGNYGWPRFEAFEEFDFNVEVTAGTLTPPLVDLAPAPPPVVPTGIAVFPNDRYGPGTAGDLVYGEFATGRIIRARLNEARYAVEDRFLFADTTTVQGAFPIELFFDVDGTLYVATGFHVFRAVPAE